MSNLSLIRKLTQSVKSYADGLFSHSISDLATTEKNGLMSSADKANLDTGILKALRESSGAGRFNSLYRGKNLGTTSVENLADISRRIANNFEDLYCGDYVSGVSTGLTYDFAHADYYKYNYLGSFEYLPPHHILVVPRWPGTVAGWISKDMVSMNETNTTEGAYVGSKLFKETLNTVFTFFASDFGEDHILKYYEILQNTVTNGKPTGCAEYDRKTDLLCEIMVYGCNIYGSAISDGADSCRPITYSYSQLALFRHRKDLVQAGACTYFLRDVADSMRFCAVAHQGHATRCPASNGQGIRPYFLIY